MSKMRERFEWQPSEQLKGNRQDFVIQLNNGQVIGRCALYEGKREGGLEFGITIYRPYWGNGYAGEVLETIIPHAFKKLGAKEILFRTEPENVQMLKQYEKYGIPKTLDAAEDTPEAPFFHRYHHFVLTRGDW